MPCQTLKDQAAEVLALDEKRTQGEWRVTSCMDVWVQAGEIGVAQTGDTHWEGETGVVSTQEEMEHNGRFIAAAPRMASIIRQLLARDAEKDVEIAALKEQRDWECSLKQAFSERPEALCLEIKQLKERAEKAEAERDGVYKMGVRESFDYLTSIAASLQDASDKRFQQIMLNASAHETEMVLARKEIAALKELVNIAHSNVKAERERAEKAEADNHNWHKKAVEDTTLRAQLETARGFLKRCANQRTNAERAAIEEPELIRLSDTEIIQDELIGYIRTAAQTALAAMEG
jgi:hypothetical protein